MNDKYDILSIINKKRLHKSLTREEIESAFMGYLNGSVENYQMSSLLMAICINGMNIEETINLTDVMLKSGEMLDTTKIKGIQVDKHSTGGVGDKTTLIIGPILASLGLKVAKLSGRGLGLTGGTIDKLESIPGLKLKYSDDEFIDKVNKVGFALMEQTKTLAPLDKVIYDLRNATGTVSSVPLIASSIMSKKLAVGAKYILIDLKVGSGALLESEKEAKELADAMIKIGKSYSKVVIPVLSGMDTPLGDNVGNALEVIEAIDVLKGKKGQLRDLSVELSSVLLSKATSISVKEAKEKVNEVLDNQKAYKKFLDFINSQGGNIDGVTVSRNIVEVQSLESGVIKDISASKIAQLSLDLGAGKKKLSDKVDHEVGIVLNKHIGDRVIEGDILCYIYQNDKLDHLEEARAAFKIIKEK